MDEAQDRQLTRYEELMSFVSEKYYRPDTTALAVVMSTVAAHFHFDQRPIWAIVQGEPGSGKTEIAMAAAQAIAPEPDAKGEIPRREQEAGQPPVVNVAILDSFSKQSLLSGYGKTGKPDPRNSLLILLGKYPILIIPDLTIFLSTRADVRSEALGLLRGVWDGRVSRSLGNSSGNVLWSGKATIIAASTPGAEVRLADSQNDLGNRFMTITWKMDADLYKLAERATENIKEGDIIRKGVRARARAIYQFREKALPPTKSQMDELVAVAVMAAHTRRTVYKDFKGHIIGSSGPEAPTRIVMAMAQIAQGHAGLLRHPEPTSVDIAIARRLGLDTIPFARREVLDAIASEGEGCSVGDLAQATHRPAESIRITLRELQALGLVELEQRDPNDPIFVNFSRWFKLMREKAGL